MYKKLSRRWASTTSFNSHNTVRYDGLNFTDEEIECQNLINLPKVTRQEEDMKSGFEFRSFLSKVYLKKKKLFWNPSYYIYLVCVHLFHSMSLYIF